MEQNEILVIKCTNPECGKKIRLKRPEKTVVLSVGCPHCGNKMRVKVPGKSSETVAPAESTVGTQPHKPEKSVTNNSGKVVDKASSVPDFSQAEPICIGSDFKVGTKYEELCPHCKKHTLVFSPSKPGHKEFACPKCNGRITAEVHQPTKSIHGGTEEVKFIRGKLILLRKNWFNKDYILREGRNIIGREDASAPSDISIKGDNTMSRRSVQIDMNQTEHGFFYKLTVIKAANPVVHNGAMLMNGESILLNFGDTIVMGKTKFRFDRLDS